MPFSLVGLRRLVRPSERRDTFVAFATLFGFMTGHGLLETARDALFLTNVAIEQLPWVYIGIAGISLFLNRLGSRSRRLRVSLALWLALSGCVALAFWPLIGMGPWAAYLLYLWSAAVTSVVLVRFYLLVGRRFTILQAKRVYSVIGAGGVAGALTGAAAAGGLASLFAPLALLIAAGCVLLLSSLGPFLFSETSIEEEVPDDSARQAASSMEVLRKPYVRNLGVLLLLGTVLFTFVDYLFKAFVVVNVEASDLAGFLGRIYFCFNLASLLIQILLVRRVLQRLGPCMSTGVISGLLGVAAVPLVFTGGFIFALMLKGIDGVLRHSLYRTATELLFVPMQDELRKAAKSLIGVVGHRGGQAVASAAILAVIAVTDSDRVVLTSVVLVLGVSTVALALMLRRQYRELFEETLRKNADQSALQFPEFDLASLESLLVALGSSDDEVVKASLTLLARRGRMQSVPSLILRHGSPDVLEHALNLLTESGRRDFLAASDPLLNHEYAAVRAAALRARMKIEPDESLIRERLELTCPVVKATALVGLVSSFSPEESEMQKYIDGVVETGSVVAREALARAMEHGRSDWLDRQLIRLAASEEIVVLQSVLRSMSASANATFIPYLIDFLPRRPLRRAAERALAALGMEGLAALEGRIDNAESSLASRLYIPGAMAAFPPDIAVEALLGQLERQADTPIVIEVVRCLNRAVIRHGEFETMKVDARRLEAARERFTRDAYRFLDWFEVLDQAAIKDPSLATPVHQLLQEALREMQLESMNQILLLVEAQQPSKSMTLACAAVRQREGRARASGMEVIEAYLPSSARAVVMNLFDDAPNAEKLRVGRAMYQSSELGYADLFGRLMNDDNPTIRALAVAQIGELGLVRWTNALTEMKSGASGSLSEVLVRALGTLVQPPKPVGT